MIKVLEFKYNLQGANLTNADLSKEAFEKYDLDADFYDANLKKAILHLTNLKNVSLYRAELQESKIFGTILQGANLVEANLQDSLIMGANFQNALLISANLSNAKIGFTNFQNARLGLACIHKAQFQSSNLTNSYLGNADLKNSTFMFDIMKNANLVGANLSGVSFCDVDLSGAYLFKPRGIKAVNLPEPAQQFLLRLLICKQIRARFFYDFLIIILLFLSLLFPVILKPFAQFIPKILFMPLPFIPFVLPLFLLWFFYKGGFKEDKIIADALLGILEKRAEEREEKGEKPQGLWKINWLRRILHPTRWCGAMVDAVGRCDPLDLRYIKDQSWLEAKIEKASSFWMYLWGITCGYGTNIWLWIFWSAVIAMSFGATYWLGGNSLVQLESTIRQSPDIFTYFYYSIVTFSIVTFTTLGFGDVVPTSWVGEVIVTFEVIIGYIMLGGLISIFANLLARRA